MAARRELAPRPVPLFSGRSVAWGQRALLGLCSQGRARAACRWCAQPAGRSGAKWGLFRASAGLCSVCERRFLCARAANFAAGSKFAAASTCEQSAGARTTGADTCWLCSCSPRLRAARRSVRCPFSWGICAPGQPAQRTCERGLPLPLPLARVPANCQPPALRQLAALSSANSPLSARPLFLGPQLSLGGQSSASFSLPKGEP